MLVNGQAIAQKILTELKTEVAELPFRPLFCDVLVGEDAVSRSYVNIKLRRAEEIGLEGRCVALPISATTTEVIAAIQAIQKEKNLAGLIIQLPLPKELDQALILSAIAPQFDVDALTAKSQFVPPTAAAVLEVLDSLNLNLATQKILMIGQGDLVGRPVTALLTERGLNVQTADGSTDLQSIVPNADIIISGTGQPKLITGDLIKQAAVLIDCGTAESGGGIVGDVDLESVRDKASVVSPVPGGVGPITVAKLLSNVVESAKTIRK